MYVDEVEADSCPELAVALADAGLPVDDLGEPGRHFFRFCGLGGALVGFIGWEEAGGSVLLRSLVVLPAMRGKGIGRTMTDWILDRLRGAGVAEVYILTTTIADVAARMGFEPVDRDLVPAGIRASRQSSTLCPSSAVVMRRRLR